MQFPANGPTPDDGLKQVFFTNVFATLHAADDGRKFTVFSVLQLFRIVVYADEFLDLLPFLGYGPVAFACKYLLVHTAWKVVDAIGWGMGVESWRREVTPRRLWVVAEGRGGRGGKGGKMG